MSAALRAELLKLRTTRTFGALVGASVALSLLVVVLTAVLGSDFSEHDVRNLFTADFSGLFILLLGVIGMAGEWRHRTITGTVLAVPDRWRLLSAKVLSYAVAGAVLSLIVTVTVMAIGTVILSARGETTAGVADLADVLWRNLVTAGLAGAVGVCIGGLLRNQVIAIVGLLVFSFAVEPTLLALAPDVGRFGPLVGAPNAITGGGAVADEDTLAAGIAVLVMLGWVGLGFGATGILLRRRDLI
jgi:hypothetical protein